MRTEDRMETHSRPPRAVPKPRALELTPLQAGGRPDGDTVFDLDELEVFYGTFRAVRGVTMKILKNEMTAFIGPSGCGKTTVLRSFNRMHDVTPGARVAGGLRYRGAELYGANVSATEVRRRIGMVFQKPNPFPKSIYDNVAFGPRSSGVRSAADLDVLVEKSLRSAALWE